MATNYRTRYVMVAAALMVAGLARGQSGGAAAGDLLAPEVRDDARGIRICPPTGSRMAQRAGDEVLSFVNDQRQWAGGVRYVFLAEGVHRTLEEYLKSNADAMNKTFKGVSIEKSEVIKLGERRAGRQISAFDVQQETVPGHPEHIPFLKQDVMVEIGPDQFVHVTMFAPLKDRELAARTFDAMLSTFQLRDVAQDKARRYKNVEAGLKWLVPMTADQLQGKLVPGPQYLRIMVSGKELGYLRMEEAEETQDGLKGISVLVKSFTFQPDGTTLTSTNKAWWAYVLKGGEPIVEALGKSSWESTVRSIPPAAMAGGPWLWQQEKGATKFDAQARGTRPGEENEIHPSVLLTVDTAEGNDKGMDMVRAMPGHREFGIDERLPRPLPKALEFLWPRAVDLGKPMEMSFPVYNSGTKKMGLRTLSVIGEETVEIDGRQTKAVHLMDELDSGSTSIWVDRQGRTLMMKTSDGASLMPATQEVIDQKYGDKLRRAGLAG